MERRFQTGPAPVRVEKRADGSNMIVGYAAVYHRQGEAGTEYRLWEDVVERIKPGAFDRAIKEDDVRALFNHEPALILGRMKAGTLRLSVDSVGLRYEIDPPDTQAGRDTVESIKRGDVSGSSFAFVPRKRATREETDADGRSVYIVELEEVELYDVGPVTYPAYAATETGVRSDAVRRGVEDLKRAAADRAVATVTADLMDLGIDI